VIEKSRFDEIKYVISMINTISLEEAESLILKTETGRAIKRKEENVLYDQDISNVIAILEELGQGDYELSQVKKGIDIYEKDYYNKLEGELETGDFKFQKLSYSRGYQERMKEKQNMLLKAGQKALLEIRRAEHAVSVRK